MTPWNPFFFDSNPVFGEVECPADWQVVLQCISMDLELAAEPQSLLTPEIEVAAISAIAAMFFE